jgi:hypothetical protein
VIVDHQLLTMGVIGGNAAYRLEREVGGVGSVSPL